MQKFSQFNFMFSTGFSSNRLEEGDSCGFWRGESAVPQGPVRPSVCSARWGAAKT